MNYKEFTANHLINFSKLLNFLTIILKDKELNGCLNLWLAMCLNLLKISRS